MKKKISFILIVLVFMLTALGSGSPSTNDQNTNVSADNVETNNVIASIDEQVIFNEKGITITAKEIVDSWSGQDLKILIENNSGKDILVSTEALAINGYMVTGFLYETVSDGAKSNATLSCLSSDLINAGISGIGEIEIWFSLIDSNSYSTVYESKNPVVIKTNLYDQLDASLDINGVEIINQNGIKMIVKYVDENSFWGTSVLVYLENNSGQNVTVTCEKTSINGFMINGYYYSSVKDGHKSFDTMTFFSSELEENEIEKVENIKMSFSCYNADTYREIFNSNNIVVNVD